MKIEIYSRPNCSWCVKAKEIMNSLGLSYTEKVLNVDYTKEELVKLVSQPHVPLTVPQIFVDGRRIGGYEDLCEYLESTGIMGLQN